MLKKLPLRPDIHIDRLEVVSAAGKSLVDLFSLGGVVENFIRNRLGVVRKFFH